MMRWPRVLNRPALIGLAFIAVAIPVGLAAAQSQAEIETQIQEGFKNAQALLANLPTLQKIEAEEAAMRDLLNQTQDDLRAERARREALEVQLRALAGDVSPDPQKTPGNTGEARESKVASESALWLALPPHHVNALGILDTTARAIGTVPQGTQSLVPQWPRHAVLPDGVAWPEVEVEGAHTRIVQGGTLGARRVLATLELRGGEVFWSWTAAPHGGGANTADAWLEPLLRRCVFAAQRAGVTLATYQIAPFMLNLPEGLSAGATLTLSAKEYLGTDPAIGPVALRIEQDGTEAQRLDADGSHAAWLLRDATLFVNLAADGSSLSVRRGPGVAGRIGALERQRQAWQRDLQARPGAAPPDADIVAQAEAEIQQLDEQITALRAAQSSKQTPADPPIFPRDGVGGTSPMIRLIDPETGVVLTRLMLSGEPVPTPLPGP